MIELKNYSVSLSDKTIIKDINFNLEPGSSIGICLLYTSDAADEAGMV